MSVSVEDPTATQSSCCSSKRSRASTPGAVSDAGRRGEVGRREVEDLVPLGGRRDLADRQVGTGEVARDQVGEGHGHDLDVGRSRSARPTLGQPPLEAAGGGSARPLPEAGRGEKRRGDHEAVSRHRREVAHRATAVVPARGERSDEQQADDDRPRPAVCNAWGQPGPTVRVGGAFGHQVLPGKVAAPYPMSPATHACAISPPAGVEGREPGVDQVVAELHGLEQVTDRRHVDLVLIYAGLSSERYPVRRRDPRG